jgi:hypothetical protein
MQGIISVHAAWVRNRSPAQGMSREIVEIYSESLQDEVFNLTDHLPGNP